MSKIFSVFATRLIIAVALSAAFYAASPTSAGIVPPPPADGKGSISGHLKLEAAPSILIRAAGDIYRMIWTSIARVSATYPTKRGDGTSFLVDDRGDLATNCHVVMADDSTGPVKVEIQFPDDPTWLPAKVLGCDEEGDIAVLHVDGLPPTRQPLRFARSGTFGPGDEVMVVGYALGLDGDPSVTTGSISALHRSLVDGAFGDLVQTNAAINHGNSGGPMLDMHGEVVGVNTYIERSTLDVGDVTRAQKKNTINAGPPPEIDLKVVQGIFYARSAVTAQVYVQEIISSGRVRRPDLGVAVSWMDSNWLHLPRQGVKVDSVTPGSLAARVGLAKDMIIYAIDLGSGVVWKIRTPGDFRDALALMSPSQAIKLYFYALTDKGTYDANGFDSVPMSEAKWFSVDVMPASTLSGRVSAN
jgi:S1-C subfamily serine protease